MSNLFSVIIPTRNASSEIAGCLKSLQQQVFQDFEVCIVDACSTDETLAVAMSYQGKVGAGLRYQSKPDVGVYDAMNMGIMHSTGDWLYFIGADDVLYDDDVFADVASFIAASEADIVYGDVVLRSNGRRFFGETSWLRLQYDRNICHQAIFYRRSVFERIGFYNLSYPIWADWDMNIRCFRDSDIRCLWMDRIIATYNDTSGISCQNDIEFKRMLPGNISRYIVRKYYWLKKRLFDLRTFYADK